MSDFKTELEKVRAQLSQKSGEKPNDREAGGINGIALQDRNIPTPLQSRPLQKIVSSDSVKTKQEREREILGDELERERHRGQVQLLEIESLNHQLATEKALRERTEAKLQNEIGRATGLTRQVQELQESISGIASREEVALLLEIELDDRQSKLKIEADRLAAVADILIPLETLESDNTKLRSRNTRLGNQNHDLNEAVAKHLASIERQRKILEELKGEFKSARQAIEDLSADNKSMAAKSRQAASEVMQLKQSLEQAMQRANAEMCIRGFDTVKWLVESGVEFHGSAFPTKIHTHGSGPWDGGDFDEMLQDIGFALYPCGDYVDSGIELLIVGRENWDGDAIEAYINNRGGRPVKVFPQELFVAALACGCDPFDLVVGDGPSKEIPDVLEHFGRGHPVIELLRSLEFPWPQFDSDVGSPVHPGEWDRVEETPLAVLGYHVGIVANLSDRFRRDILAEAFVHLELPWVESIEYMESWGTPSSRDRLRRMAHHVAMLIRSNKSKSNFGTAVGQWTSDLEWMRRTYYKSIMRFAWP